MSAPALRLRVSASPLFRASILPWGPLYRRARASGFAAKPVGCGVNMATKPSHRVSGASIHLPSNLGTWACKHVHDAVELHSAEGPKPFSQARRCVTCGFLLYVILVTAIGCAKGRRPEATERRQGRWHYLPSLRVSNVFHHQEQERTRRRFTPHPQPTFRHLHMSSTDREALRRACGAWTASPPPRRERMTPYCAITVARQQSTLFPGPLVRPRGSP